MPEPSPPGRLGEHACHDFCCRNAEQSPFHTMGHKTGTCPNLGGSSDPTAETVDALLISFEPYPLGMP